MAQTVLVVDDEWQVRKLAAMALEAGGYKVSQAEGARQALELMATEHVDLVFTDWMMPGMGGRELIEKIRELPHGDEIPVVVFSGVTPPQEIKQAEQLGVRHWLRKPCRIRHILDLVGSVLGNAPRPAVH